MEYVGFTVMIIAGIYLICAGIVMQFVSYGFIGRISVGALIPLLMGAALIVFTISHTPFTITFN